MVDEVLLEGIGRLPLPLGKLLPGLCDIHNMADLVLPALAASILRMQAQPVGVYALAMPS